MKRTLTFADRTNLLNSLLPQFGDIDTMEAVESIEGKIKFNTKEVEASKVQIGNGRISWDEKGAASVEPIEVEFTKAELDVISDHITVINNNQRLQKVHLQTVRKFWTKPKKEKKKS